MALSRRFIRTSRLNINSRSFSTVAPRHAQKDGGVHDSAEWHGKHPTAGNKDLDVGEIEGGSFKVSPMRRAGEDDGTMRARLLYQSRKRGILESDLLLSTFAHAQLHRMSRPLLESYDRFLDENDWDIYYWATQEAAPETRGRSPETAPTPGGRLDQKPDGWRGGGPRSGEWAQTVGAFKPAYRPVPERWQGSEILNMLRRHVEERSAAGVGSGEAGGRGGGLEQSVQGAGGGGLGFMPALRAVR